MAERQISGLPSSVLTVANRSGLSKICKTIILSAAVGLVCTPFIAQASVNAQDKTTTAQTTQFLDFYSDQDLDNPDKDLLQEAIENRDGKKLWHDYPISDNDRIETVFMNEGLSQLDLMRLLDLREGVKYLSDLNQAESLRYKLDGNGRMTCLEIILKTSERLRFDRDLENGNADFTLSVMQASMSQEVQRIQGDIQHSFYKSGVDAGLSASVIQQYANIFQWDIDFNRDLRAGDRFEILLKKTSGEVEQIIGARLYQNNKTLTALRYTDGRYYSVEGRLLGSSFDRFPLNEGYRVSSHFNPARKHPITRQIRAHKGTDWAVPINTDIKATADGVVVKAVKNHPSAGNYIEIRNGRRYVTRFLHMNSLNVKAGDTVTKGDVIGQSGNTGLSTGPHLHYELYVDGRAVNAMKARLPEGKTLTGTELAAFKQNTSGTLVMLEQHGGDILLAKKNDI